MRVITAVAMISALVSSAVADELQDMADLQALDQAYATAWMAGDADGVMALFTEDATIVPHHGNAPTQGHDAIRDLWFNPEHPPTVVPEFRREPRELLLLGDVGVIRGRSRMVWEYDGERTTIPLANYVIIAVRQDQGWRIRLLTWNDDPRKWIVESLDDEESG